MATTHKRQLRNFLLDRTFQLRYTATMVLISCVLTAGLGYFWYDEMRKASRIVEVKALATMSDEEVKEVEQDLARQDQIRLLVLVGFALLIAFVLAGYGIVFTHKVAGPLFKISRHMREIRDEKLDDVWDLRKGDQLQEFWAVFKEMHSTLQQRHRDEVASLEQVIAAIEGKEGLEEQASALRAMSDRKRTALGEAFDKKA